MSSRDVQILSSSWRACIRFMVSIPHPPFFSLRILRNILKQREKGWVSFGVWTT